MADFPILSRQPSKGVQVTFKNTGDVKNEDDTGYITARKRYTRMPRQFNFTLSGLDCNDYVLLSEFIYQVSTVGNFNWTNPVDDVVYDVRFTKIPILATNPPFHSTSIQIEEV